MIMFTNREANLNKGEDPEHLLDIRKRPFDNYCDEFIPLDSYQLGTFQDICGYWYLWRPWKASGPPSMAYDLLRTEFLKITDSRQEHLSEYTVSQVVYCIRNTLHKSSIPTFLLEGRNKTNIWRQRYDLLVKPNILRYWHEQERTFLAKKHQYDSTHGPDEKDDPWWYFAEYETVVFRPERDLPAAYLVLGAALDSAAATWIFSPKEIRDGYPEFFGRRVTRADGQEYKPEIELNTRDESEFFESLWIQIKLDLQSNGLLDQGLGRKPLSERSAMIYKKLRSLKPHQAMTTPKIQEWYERETGKNLDEGTWNKIRKALLPYGLKNSPRVGYYIRGDDE